MVKGDLEGLDEIETEADTESLKTEDVESGDSDDQGLTSEVTDGVVMDEPEML